MSRTFRIVGAITATALIGSAITAGSALAETSDYKGLPNGTQTNKTLVIGIDGAAYDFLDAADMPNLDALRAGGMTSYSNLYANPMAPTVSGPAWSTMVTGVWPDKHNAVDNGFSETRYDQYPDYLTRIEKADPARSSLVVATWAPVADTIFSESVDLQLARQGGDAGTANTAADLIRNGNPDNVFIHLDEVDGAGHSGGTNNATRYLGALAKADREIGQMVDAVKNRPTYASEQWTIIVTSDHGHLPTGGHGGNTPVERKVFVIAAGPGFEPGSMRYDAKIVDIATTALDANGIAIDPAWDLDGEPIQKMQADDFDSLRPKLQTQVDETRPGPNTLGWTHETPEGSSIDNSKMPTGGITELRGWTFVTDEFWTNIELNQKRETSVRMRDVFAVADSDEWDDKAHAPGQFDSTLISPDYDLTGASQATLAFASNYQIDGPQSGTVLVSFDGGEPVAIKNYDRNTNANERLTFDVPAGAQKVQFRFHYTGSNSYFWAVDRVRFEQPVPTAPSAPLNVTATAGDTVATVTWQAPATDGHSTITNYTVTATPVGTTGKAKHAPVVTCQTTELTCELTGLTNKVDHVVTVTASNAYGVSDDSVSVTIYPENSKATPAQPPSNANPGKGKGPKR